MTKNNKERFIKGDSGDRHTFGEDIAEDMAEDYPVKKHTRGGRPVKKHTRGEGKSEGFQKMSSAAYNTKEEASKEAERYENKTEIRETIRDGKIMYMIFGEGKLKTKPKVKKTVEQMTREEYFRYQAKIQGKKPIGE